jgi:hypothetical protein
MDSITTEKTLIKYQAVIDAIRKAEPNRVLTTEEIANIIQQSSNAVRSTNDRDDELSQPLSPALTDYISVTTSSRGSCSDDTTIIPADDGLPAGLSGTSKRTDTPYPCGTASTQFRRVHIELDPSSAEDNGLPSSTTAARTSALERLARIAKDRRTPSLFTAFTAADPPIVFYDDIIYPFSEFMKLPPISVVNALLRLEATHHEGRMDIYVDDTPCHTMIKAKICYSLKECAKRGDDMQVEFLGYNPEMWIVMDKVIFTQLAGKHGIIPDTGGRSPCDTWEQCNIIPITFDYLKTMLEDGRLKYRKEDDMIQQILEFIIPLCSFAFCECLRDILRYRLQEIELTCLFEHLVNLTRTLLIFANKYSKMAYSCNMINQIVKLIDLEIENWVRGPLRQATARLKPKPTNLFARNSRHVGLVMAHEEFQFDPEMDNKRLVSRLERLACQVNMHEGIYFDKVMELKRTCQALLFGSMTMKMTATTYKTSCHSYKTWSTFTTLTTRNDTA